MNVLFSLDALLLFLFSLPVVFKYRILPIEGTPYWLFGILFFFLLSNWSSLFIQIDLGLNEYPGSKRGVCSSLWRLFWEER